MANIMKTIKKLLETGMKAYQIEKVCNERGIRLSVMGWSKYAVEDGVLKLHYHFGSEEFTEEIQLVEELSFFDNENVADFEYQQSITADMIKALRS